jgi:anthranilate synthase component 2
MSQVKIKEAQPSILVIDNYDSFTWNLVHYLAELGAKTNVVRNDALTTKEVWAQKPDGIVLSPGPCTPNEAGICLDLVDEASDDIPIFGVCLGHQSIGQACGGKVVSAQEILHGKTSAISHTGHQMFNGIPKMYEAVRYHSLSVERETLPDELEITAQTEDGEIMALAHKNKPITGVQFHPESIGTEYGHALLANFLMTTI